MISSYPDRDGEPAKQNAVACYAENLMKAYKKRDVVILAEDKDSGGKWEVRSENKVYRQGNLLIVRCWKPGSPFLYPQIIEALKDFDKVRNILIQFEFNMLGSVVLTTTLPGFTAYLRLMGKKVTIMQHQVVDDLAILGGHLNVAKGSVKASVLNTGLRAFYKGLGVFANSIIVHEELLKEKLARWVNKEKISVVSHGMALDTFGGESKATIRKGMGLKGDDFVLLVFGYIAWYKGVDWIIKKVAEINKKFPEKNIRLIVAGGPSATLQSKAHYRKYLARVQEMISDNSNVVRATGYVPDEDVYKYFKAADLVVLPYRAMMSASGPLSFALRFGKPYIVSETLAESFKNPDIEIAQLNSGIDLSKIVFAMKGKDFEQKITDVATLGYLPKAKQFVGYLRQLRTWDNIVLEYDKVVFGLHDASTIDFTKNLANRLLSRFTVVNPNENI